MIILRLLLLLTNLHLKLLSTQGTGADKLLSAQRVNIAVLDFSKAFDTVPHDGLLSKLKHYGLDKNISQWISNFLKKNKTMCRS